MSWATSRRVQDGRLAKRDRARVACLGATRKPDGIRGLELALKEPIELRVPWRLLAVLDAHRVGLLQDVKMKAPFPS
jgi:hypothetical protein